MALERIGDIVAGNLLRQPLSDSRFAYPGITHDYRVVLGPPREYLHHPLDLFLTTDNRVKLTLAGHLGQVTTVLFQGTIFTLRPGVGNPVPAAKLLQGKIDLFLVNTEALQDAGCLPSLLPGHGNQQVFGADELVFEPVGLGRRCLYKPGNTRGGIYLCRFVVNTGVLREGCFHPLPHCLRIDPQLPQDAADQPLLLLEERQQDMFYIPLAMAVLFDQLLRESQCLLCLLGKPFLSH